MSYRYINIYNEKLFNWDISVIYAMHVCQYMKFELYEHNT